jgi:putative addiction module component (TIGR02574 family)
MSSSDQIAESALGLPIAERARLVTRLLESLDEARPDADIEQAWEQETARRVQDLLHGRAKTIPASQALSDARAKLNSRR